MNISDIEVLLNRIGGILASKATPDVIISNRPTVLLSDVTKNYQINICSLQILYNEFKGRSSNEGIIVLDHIAASIATNEDELLEVLRLLQNSKYSHDSYSELNIRRLFQKLIVVSGTPLQAIHSYVLNLMNQGRNLRDIYESLKGLTSISGKSMSIPAILGGIAYADTKGGVSRIGIDQLFLRLLSFESPDSPLHISTAIYRDSIEWYNSLINPIVSRSDFYNKALMLLKDLPTVDLSLYPPAVKTEWLSIRPLEHLDIVDMLMQGRTSEDMPALMINNNLMNIFKALDSHRKDLSWFANIKPFTLKTIVRISRNPEKYLPIEYLATKNWFSFKRKDKYLPITDISNILCQQLNIESLTTPMITSTTYLFITNYIANGTEFGINKDLMAWLIMNPPDEYKKTGILNFVFMKEDTKPNMLKKLLNIHILLGTEKMYLSISKLKTTDGTVVETLDGLVGFVGELPYLAIKINKCPTLSHAMICQLIYAHLITMYLKYHKWAADKIFEYTSSWLPRINPVVVPLRQEELTLHRIFKHADPIMYNYISSERAEALPVPIQRSEVEAYRMQGYGVMKLPTIVVNNPSITFETLGTLWVRTHSKGQSWALRLKDQGGYIPMSKGLAPSSAIPVKVRPDWTLEELYTLVSSSERPFRENKTMNGEVGRYAYVSESIHTFLDPLISSKRIWRHYISANILYSLNKALVRKVTADELAIYAHLCKLECWNLTLEEIRDDIKLQKIYPMKHIRALEAAFKINIYLLMDDTVEPYLRKPDHFAFHLHKPADKTLPTLIMHSMKEEPEVFTIIMKLPVGRVTQDTYLFPTTDYLDLKFADINNIRMINPSTGFSDALRPAIIQKDLFGWKPVSLIVDAQGKTRALNYSKGSQIVTISIGLSYILDMPIGLIQKPSNLFLQDVPLQYRKDMEGLILQPTPSSDFELWRTMERNARILRVILHTLYSISLESLEDFMDRFDVVEDVEYETSNIPHSMPQLGASDVAEAWDYFASITKGILESEGEDYRILVPSEKTLEAMRLYLKAQDKIKWPLYFPYLIKYKWDVPANIGESVYLSEADLLQQIVVDRVPPENTQFIVTTIPYILSRNNFKYLIQMVRDREHGAYIIDRWNKKHINLGFNSEGILPYDDIKYVDPSIATELELPAMALWGNKWFVLFPI